MLGLLGGFGGTAIVLKSQALGITVKPYIEAAKVAGSAVTVADSANTTISKLGENITISRFSRYQLGEKTSPSEVSD